MLFFSGRSSTSEWFFPCVFVFVGWALTVFVSPWLSLEYPLSTTNNILSDLWLIAMAVPLTAVTVRRLHDQNKYGWWVLLFIVPFALLAMANEISLVKEAYPNHFDLSERDDSMDIQLLFYGVAFVLVIAYFIVMVQSSDERVRGSTHPGNRRMDADRTKPRFRLAMKIKHPPVSQFPGTTLFQASTQNPPFQPVRPNPITATGSGSRIYWSFCWSSYFWFRD